MAVLQVLRGSATDSQFLLNENRMVIGRHPNCQIVLHNGVVSRHHAQILESHGTFYIEDLRSRNGTYVNGERIEGRTELDDGDEIRLCDVELTFLLHPSSIQSLDDSAHRKTLEYETDGLSSSISMDESRIYALPGAMEDDFGTSTSIRKLSPDEDSNVSVNPEIKLKAILEITRALGRELEIDSVLPKMLETLFNIFPQAQQGFVLLLDSESGKLKVKASRSRGGVETDSVAVSMTVVRHAMQTRESILSQNVSDDSRFKKNTALNKAQIRSMMCVPIVGQDQEGLGVIQIVTRNEDQAFTDEDLELLATLATQASMAIENARMHEEQIKRKELERDLEFATQVQLGFLPKSRPNLPNYSFADYYEAALSVGGDYFDYIQLPDGRLALALGDVAGKGMPAALLMARLYSSTRFQLLTRPTIEEAVSGLNQEISGSGLGHRFITFVVMVIDPDQHEITIVNAGHLCPLLRRANGTVELIGKENSSLPLGIVPDLAYESSKVTIENNDTIIAFTDGVTEAMNNERKIYGNERLAKLFSEAAGDIQDVIETIVEDVENFTGDVVSRDDTCLIGVRRSDV
ncbi:MAG: SpoIIE family protein phosphatase [Planctomycetaceae bacterium]|nr:SpoIIE family protein phosphatase [Planctomycetaceae bacterium]